MPTRIVGYDNLDALVDGVKTASDGITLRLSADRFLSLLSLLPLRHQRNAVTGHSSNKLGMRLCWHSVSVSCTITLHGLDCNTNAIILFYELTGATSISCTSAMDIDAVDGTPLGKVHTFISPLLLLVSNCCHIFASSRVIHNEVMAAWCT